MSEITKIPSSAGWAGLPAPARFFAGLRGVKLRPDLVLIGLAGLFAGLGIYSLFTAPVPGSAMIPKHSRPSFAKFRR